MVYMSKLEATKKLNCIAECANFFECALSKEQIEYCLKIKGYNIIITSHKEEN